MLLLKNLSTTALLIFIFSGTSVGQSGNEVVYFKTSIKVESGKLVEEKSFLLQINNKQSDWISDIEIQYNKDDKLEIIEASIINYLGITVRKLKKKEIVTRSDISYGTFYEDNMVKAFNLKWNEYPYRIKYSYRKTYAEFLQIAHWYPVLYSNVPTSKATLQVELPFDYAVNLDYPDSIQHTSTKLQNSYHYYWEVNDVSVIERELFTPPYQELIPSVSMVPKNFKYGINGSFETWSSFGNWINRMNEQLDLLPQSEKDKVDQLIRGITDKKEVVKTLYHYMQDNTRYINVSIDIGGLKPYPASYVCENKYGDCKALTIYMKALLNYAGIPSHYTIIYAGNNPVKVHKKIPSQQFNHVILNIPIDGDTLWLENTANYLPFNYLGTFTQNRYALLVDGKNSRLVKTPVLALEDVLEKNNYHFNLDEDGNGTVTISKDFSGGLFEAYKYTKNMLSKKEQQQQIEKRISLSNYELASWDILHPDRDEPTIKLDLELAVTDQLRKLGNMIVMKAVPLKILDFESPESRKTPVRINYPIHKSDSIIYDLPFMNSYQVKLPKDINLESEYGKYAVHHTITNGQLIITRSFQLFMREYNLAAYGGFYSFIESIKTSQQKSNIVLNQL